MWATPVPWLPIAQPRSAAWTQESASATKFPPAITPLSAATVWEPSASWPVTASAVRALMVHVTTGATKLAKE